MMNLIDNSTVIEAAEHILNGAQPSDVSITPYDHDLFTIVDGNDNGC
jgi:hypothetical protein